MKSKNISIFPAACILPLMLLVVAPLTFYFGNTNEIAFTLTDIVFQVIGLFVVLSMILFLSLYLVRNRLKLSNIMAGLYTGLAIAIWAQSQLLVWNFGLFRGQAIRWSDWRIHMYLEFGIWLLIIAGSIVVFLKKNRQFTNTILTGIYLAAIVSVAASFFSSSHKSSNAVEIDDAKLQDVFSFHSKNNVLLILLDTFQSDYFEYITEAYPDEVSDFEGFTFFRNTASVFPTTKASLPSIISGSFYLNDKPFDTFISEAYQKFNLIDAYKKKSYSSYLVGITGTSPDVVSMEDIVDQLGENYVHPIYKYLDFALFRSLPTYFKPNIYNNGIWLFTFLERRNYPPDNFGVDVQFLELFEKAATIVDDKKTSGTFKILHFSIPHLPICINENLQYDHDLTGPEGYIKQARGALKVARRILATVKKLGIYDNSEIVILSDHGTMNIPQARWKNNPVASITSVSSNVRRSSHALLLHKPVNSVGKIVINDAPLQISDVACVLGVRQGDSACSNYTLAMSGGQRLRHFYFYNWDDTWKMDNLPDMTEYFISGHVFDKASYHKGKYKYSPIGIVELQKPNFYQLGQPVLFSDGGESEAFVLNGWGKQESTHRWTDGTVAALSFQLKQRPQHDLVMHLWGLGFIDNENKAPRQIQVHVNGKAVASWKVLAEGEFEAHIPAGLVTDEMINVGFDIQNPSASSDGRQLGMAVFKLIIEENKD
jgi:hypothetical protein